jgi:hypothetical protein
VVVKVAAGFGITRGVALALYGRVDSFSARQLRHAGVVVAGEAVMLVVSFASGDLAWCIRHRPSTSAVLASLLIVHSH